MVSHETRCRWSAIARIDASFVSASQVVGAVVVARAFWSFARHQRVSAVAFVAMTARLVVVVSLADGVGAALSKLAWVGTFPVDAGFHWRAVAV